MDQGARTAATAHFTSQHEVNIFRTALRHIGRGFVEIAQGIGLIAEGTLRPVRSLVPSLLVLIAIAAVTVVTLVTVVTAVARSDTQLYRDNDAWTRWNSSPEIRIGDNDAIANSGFVAFTDPGGTRAPRPETTTENPTNIAYTALWMAEP